VLIIVSDSNPKRFKGLTTTHYQMVRADSYFQVGIKNDHI
jgi:hypothetical protein